MGMLNLSSPKGIAVSIIMLVVGIQILTAVLLDLISAIINLSSVSNLSFSSFFASGGVVLLMLSVGILIAIFGVIGVGKGGKR